MGWPQQNDVIGVAGKGSREANRLAEMVEVEVNGDGVALRGIDVNGGGAGGKVFGGKIELEGTSKSFQKS